MTALQLVRDAGADSTCGDAGGRTRAGAPCRRPAGWGTSRREGPCKYHVHTAETPDGATRPPRHLSAESAAIWRDVVSEYRFGIEGFPILQAALEARDRATEARREIASRGLVLVNRKTGMPHRNPAVGIERDSLREFRLTWKALDLDVAPPLEAP